MIKVGNLKDLIDISWITSLVDEVMSKDGIRRPKEGEKPQGAEGDREWQRAIDAGYSPNDVYFQMFDKTNISTNIPVFHTCGRERHWWITKMMPGNFMPMHVDPHTEQQANTDRFWIPLQDWSPGHIFIFENLIVTNYFKGDVYKYKSAQGLHGAANIGFSPRIVLQVTLYDK